MYGVACMIVRHKENVLGSATYCEFYVSYLSFGRLGQFVNVIDCGLFTCSYFKSYVH